MKQDNLKIIFIGDIVGRPGRRTIREFLPALKKKERINLVFANGENLAAGKGMTYETYQEMTEAGIDYFTSGNHIWNNPDIVSHLNDPQTKVLRPANYPSKTPGKGVVELNGNICLANLQGRVFMKDNVSDPFFVAKKIVDDYQDKVIIFDFHAEATSEKMAFGYFLDGKASAVLGTHTHIQTADERILKNGTAYITDIGMTGPYDSVLGIKKEIIIEKFLTQLPKSHKVASGETIFSYVTLEINTKTKRALKIKRTSKIIKSNQSTKGR